jgi:hypothetical protein
MHHSVSKRCWGSHPEHGLVMGHIVTLELNLRVSKVLERVLKSLQPRSSALGVSLSHLSCVNKYFVFVAYYFHILA